MKLSILICSVANRLTNFQALAQHLSNQAKDKPVEILWLGDNKTMSVGEKRNKLLSLAKGDYVCFVDDDDWVTNDYVDLILEATKNNPDCISFECEYTNSEIGVPTHVYFGRRFINRNSDTRMERMINHLNPIKREIATKIKYQEVSFGEDNAYALELRNNSLLQSEEIIPKILYYYRFNPKKSETWHLAGFDKTKPHKRMIKMDVVMVSDGTTLSHMTQDAINSIKGEDVNIIVMEADKTKTYHHADTYKQHKPFNYNECLNTGAKHGNADLICFTNNDVIFPPGFVFEMDALFSESGADVVSVTNQHGFVHPEIISGYCFVMTRKAYERLGNLNEDYQFWCADNVVTEQIKGMKHLRTPFVVHHLTSVSLNRLDKEKKETYTRGCVKKFNKDFNKNVLNMGV